MLIDILFYDKLNKYEYMNLILFLNQLVTFVFIHHQQFIIYAKTQILQDSCRVYLLFELKFNQLIKQFNFTMDYQLLSNQIEKPTHKWNSIDVEIWLSFISMASLIPNFNHHRIDGSCLHILDNNDLENQIGIKSKITRKKILKWIQTGFDEFNQFLRSKGSQQEKSQPILIQLPLERSNTSLLRSKQKPDNSYQNQYYSNSNQMVITTYQGPHANFYSISQTGCTIGRSQQNSIIVLQESAQKFHAAIKYMNNKFFIRDLKTNSGTFLKVFQKQTIQQKMIIQMGSFQFKINSLNHILSEIHLQFVNMLTNTLQNLKINLNQKKTYNFGRKNTNDFHYDDQHLSGIHAKITFINNMFILEDMSSTNGTWIKVGAKSIYHQPNPYIMQTPKIQNDNQFYQLTHGSVFKIGTTSTYICKFTSDKNVYNKVRCCGCQNEPDCVLYPCKHKIICNKCSVGLTACPICKIKIEDILKIFI